jgi:hypothetical protein
MENTSAKFKQNRAISLADKLWPTVIAVKPVNKGHSMEKSNMSFIRQVVFIWR